MDFIPNGNQWEIDWRDNTEEAGSPIKRPLWEPRHGRTVDRPQQNVMPLIQLKKLRVEFVLGGNTKNSLLDMLH